MCKLNKKNLPVFKVGCSKVDCSKTDNSKAGSFNAGDFKSGRYKQQHGFVLVLALVLLAVMTLIGISSMNSATMELRAAANAQHHQVAFNAVQSVLEFAISDTGAQLIDYQTSNPSAQIVTHTVNNTNNLSASAGYTGCSIGIGSSMQSGKGVRYNFFNITGTGSNKTGTATSIQTQGIRFPAAACDN